MKDQWIKLKNASSIEDIPQRYLSWQDGKYVWFNFTGKFRKVERGKHNRRIATRNRAKLFHYEPEFEYAGNLFPLSIVRLSSVPENLINQ